MKLKFYTADGSGAEERDFALPTFDSDKGRQCLKQVVVAYLANKRQGTVSTKTRSTVHGTGKKPFRQKGTGRARQGTMVGPQHYHGSVAHGPQPRDWSQKINKKMRRLALSRAVFERAVDQEVAVIEKWELPEAKTKQMDAILEKVAPEGSVLIVDDSWTDAPVKAVRNIKRAKLEEARNVNAYDFCRYDTIVLSARGMDTLVARLNGGN